MNLGKEQQEKILEIQRKMKEYDDNMREKYSLIEMKKIFLANNTKVELAEKLVMAYDTIKRMEIKIEKLIEETTKKLV